jgi:hypothetical protein
MTRPSRDPAAVNRGKRAPQSGSGEVVGSGAGAGGGGNPEDFDSDAGGSEAPPTGNTRRRPSQRADLVGP